MAIVVPRTSGPTVQTQGLPSARLTTRYDSSGQEAMGRALDKTAAVVQGIYQQEKEIADTTAVFEALNAFDAEERTLFDPANPEGVLSYRGKRALELDKTFAPQLIAKRDELMRGLSNPSQQQAFLVQSERFVRQSRDRLAGQADSEYQRYTTQEQEATLANLSDRAATAGAEGRLDAMNESLAMLEGAIDIQAGQRGESAAVVDLRKRQLLAAPVVAWAQGEIARDPRAALAKLQQRFGVQGSGENAKLLAIFGEFEAKEAAELAENPEAPEAHAWLEAQIEAAGGIPEGFHATTGGNDPFNKLTVPHAVTLMNQAEAEVRRLEAEARQRDEAGKATFAYNLQNTAAALEAGEVVPLPPAAAFAQVYGPERGAIEYSKMTVLQGMAPELRGVATASKAEIDAALARNLPTGTEDRAARDAAFSILQQRASQVLAQRKADPGTYVLQNSPPVREAFEAYAQVGAAMNKGQASAEDMTAATQRYLTTSFAEQRRLGIATPKLDTGFIAAIKDDYQRNVTKDPHGVSARLAATAQFVGDNGAALAQIADAVGPEGTLAMEGVAGPVVQRLATLRLTPEAELKKLLPQGTAWADVQEQVNKAFSSLTRTFVLQNDDATATRYRQAAELLTYERVVRGESPAQAAQAAYSDLIGNRYELGPTYRIPRSHDPEAVQVGLSRALDGLDATRLLTTPEPGFTPEESAERKLRTVRSGARWINNGNDSGVYLFGADGRAVLDTEGRPIEIKFGDAVKIPPTEEIDFRMLRNPVEPKS